MMMNRNRWYTAALAVLITWSIGAATADAQTVRRNDYLINDESYAIDVATDQFPDVASSAGGFTVVWQSRGNAFTSDIQGRLYDADGRPQGPKFMVNMSPAFGNIMLPRVARYSPTGTLDDTAGTSVVVWSEFGEFGLTGTAYAQILKNNGSHVGLPFAMDSSGIGMQYEAAVAMHTEGLGSPGAFVAVWVERRENRSTVMGRIFTGTGLAVGPAFRVHEDTALVLRRRPAVAVGGLSGIAVIAWEEGDTAAPHVRARIFTLSGAQPGPSFLVDSLLPGGTAPSVAIAGDGSFVIGFRTLVDARQDVYAQRFSAAGGRTGAPIRLGEAGTLRHRHNPDVAMHAARDGESFGFVAAWEEVEPSSSRISVHARSFNGSGIPEGEPLLISDAVGAFDSFLPASGFPALATAPYGTGGLAPTRAFIVTPDTGRKTADIYGRLLESGAIAGDLFLVSNPDTGGAAQRYPAIDVTPTGMQVAVWTDERVLTDGARIYGRRLASDGTPLGPDFPIGTATGFALDFDPAVAVFPDSSFVVAWVDGSNLQIQRFNARNERVGAPISPENRCRTAAVDGSPDGSFVVVWKKRSEPDNAEMIYAQRYRADGSPAGSVFRVDDDEAKESLSTPNVAMASDGSFAVTWSDRRATFYNVQMQRFDAADSRISTNVRVNEQIGDAYIWPAIDIAPDGSIMISWLWYRSKLLRGNIMAQRFDHNGARIGSNVRVNDQDTSLPLVCLECGDLPPAVAAAKPTPGNEEDGSFVVAWNDVRTGDTLPHIHAQWYRTDGSALGGNVRISEGPTGVGRLWPVAARDGRTANGAYFAWADDRAYAGVDWNIRGAIYEAPLQTNSVHTPADEGSVFGLRAYPNPIADRAVFSFRLPEAAHVRLTLYTITGTPAATIADGTFEAGEVRTEWNTEGIPSGVYLYRMESGTAYATGSLVIAR